MYICWFWCFVNLSWTPALNLSGSLDFAAGPRCLSAWQSAWRGRLRWGHVICHVHGRMGAPLHRSWQLSLSPFLPQFYYRRFLDHNRDLFLLCFASWHNCCLDTFVTVSLASSISLFYPCPVLLSSLSRPYLRILLVCFAAWHGSLYTVVTRYNISRN